MYYVGEKLLSDSRKKTPVDRQECWSGEQLVERPWFQLICCAPVSSHEVVAYFGINEGVGVDKTRLGPDDINLQTEELYCNYSVLIGSPK